MAPLPPRRPLVVLLACALLLGACGDDGDGDDASDAGTTTTADVRPPPDIPPTTAGEPSAPSAFCTPVIALLERQDDEQLDPAAAEALFGERRAEIAALLDVVPDDGRDEVQAFLDAFTALGEVFAGLGWDLEVARTDEGVRAASMDSQNASVTLRRYVAEACARPDLQ